MELATGDMIYSFNNGTLIATSSSMEGVIGNFHDGNQATYYGRTASRASGNLYNSAGFVCTFDTPYYINTVNFIWSNVVEQPAGAAPGSADCLIVYFYGGTNRVVYVNYSALNETASDSILLEKQNVTAIRVVLQAAMIEDPEYPGVMTGAVRLHTLNIDGSPTLYKTKKRYYNGYSVKAFAKDNDSALRVWDGSAVVGIKLGGTDDNDATRFRIQTAAGVKSLLQGNTDE